MKNKEIMVVFEGLQNVRNDTNIKFSARATFAIVKNMKMLEPIVDALIESKNQLLQKLGVPDESNSGSYFIPEENRETLTKELETLDSIENEIKFQKIKWEDIKNLNLSIQAMEALYPMIEEEN